MSRRLRNELLAVMILLVVPAVALGQTSLTELGAANAARNDMMSNSAKGATAAGPAASQPAPAAPAAGPAVSYGMKYTLSYALTGLLLGLGMYLVCRPSNRHAVE